MRRLALLLLVAAVGWQAASEAQELFLDVNRDGRCDATDVLRPGAQSVDVWYASDRNADGSAAVCQFEGDEEFALSTYSYMLMLHAWGEGAVRYGAWIPGPAVSGFRIDLGSKIDGSDCLITYGGKNALEPGRYMIGTLRVEVTGHPRLSFLASTQAFPGLVTGFGSDCPGVDIDQTIKVGHDFIDACGTAPPMDGSRADSDWDAIQKLYR